MKSMTAYASQSHRGEWGDVSIEIRAVNHRYLELFLKIPENLRSLEPELRKIIGEYCKRGRIEIFIKFRPGSDIGSNLNVNSDLAKQLLLEAQELHHEVSVANSINLIDVLRWPGVVEVKDGNIEAAFRPVLDVFDLALKHFIEEREREGSVLHGYLKEHLESLSKSVDKADARRSPMQKLMREKIVERLSEIKDELDPQRLEHEISILASKADISEELERLRAHIDQVKFLLGESEKPVGRRLDFMMQELNREANTLSAKSPDTEMTQIAIDMKTEIDQMKEQIQNIE